MQSLSQTLPVSNKTRWIGRIMSGLPVLFLLLDGVMKLFNPAPVAESMAQLGYPASLAFALGVLLLACVALYVIPQTAVLGAILLTGYFGGAIASHVRVGDGLFALIFPVIIGGLVWGGLILRDARLRAFLPLRG